MTKFHTDTDFYKSTLAYSMDQYLGKFVLVPYIEIILRTMPGKFQGFIKGKTWTKDGFVDSLETSEEGDNKNHILSPNDTLEVVRKKHGLLRKKFDAAQKEIKKLKSEAKHSTSPAALWTCIGCGEKNPSFKEGHYQADVFISKRCGASLENDQRSDTKVGAIPSQRLNTFHDRSSREPRAEPALNTQSNPSYHTDPADAPQSITALGSQGRQLLLPGPSSNKVYRSIYGPSPSEPLPEQPYGAFSNTQYPPNPFVPGPPLSSDIPPGASRSSANKRRHAASETTESLATSQSRHASENARPKRRRTSRPPKPKSKPSKPQEKPLTRDEVKATNSSLPQRSGYRLKAWQQNPILISSDSEPELGSDAASDGAASPDLFVPETNPYNEGGDAPVDPLLAGFDLAFAEIDSAAAEAALDHCQEGSDAAVPIPESPKEGSDAACAQYDAGGGTESQFAEAYDMIAVSRAADGDTPSTLEADAGGDAAVGEDGGEGDAVGEDWGVDDLFTGDESSETSEEE